MAIRLALLMAIVLPLLWSAIFFELSRKREHLLATSEAQAGHLAEFFAEQVQTTVQIIDLALVDFRNQWRDRRDGFDAAVAERQQFLEKDFVFQVSILDRDGKLVYNSNNPHPQPADFSDRTHFRVHRDLPGDKLYISEPLLGRISARWAIQFTRPLHDSKGRFDGVIVLSVPPEYFTRISRRVVVGSQDSLSVLRRQGDLLARWPSIRFTPGETFKEVPFRDAPPGTGGTMEKAAQLDGVRRRYAWQSLAKYPLAVSYGQSTEELLAPHARERRIYLASGAAVSLVLVLVGWLALNAFRLRSQRLQAEHVRKLIETAPDAFISLDAGGKVMEWNTQAEIMFGWRHQDTIGRPLHELVLPAELVDCHLAWLAERRDRRGLEAGPPAGERLEMPALHRDGRRLLLEMTVGTLRVGNALRFNAFIREISERKRVEQELRHAKETAETATRTKSEFLANMSHEIRTPLNGILGMAHVSLNADMPPAQRHYVETILRAGRGLMRIINDILDVSKLEAGKLELEHAGIHLDSLLSEVTVPFETALHEKGLWLRIDKDPSLPAWIVGDGLRIQQILGNFISNAIKFTAAGGITVLMSRVENDARGPLLRLAVRDTGIGLSPIQKATLFRPFQQGDASITRQYGGTGLGLAICRQLAELMEGEVGVDSTEGAGSTFWCVLPLQPSPRAGEAGGEARPHTSQAGMLSGARILVVEDNEFNQQVTMELLGSQGAQVSVAGNGKDALDALHAQAFDCVLMDVQMPVMDGYAATHAIRAVPAWRDLPVLALTANVYKSDRDKAAAAGMNDLVAKPFEPESLYSQLAFWLRDGRHAAPANTANATLQPAAPATLREDGVVDLGRLAAMVGDDPATIRRFVLRFIGTTEQAIAEMQAAFDARDLAALHALGHRVKSGARTVGADALAASCERLEAQPDLPQPSQLSELRMMLDAFRDALQLPRAAGPVQGATAVRRDIKVVATDLHRE
ncbi:ATP-binding protein [Noviherbaspirillum galbum]|uniref:Virulence sensor protein BvgS n=1 Tax=Noviherbaspirillum galbum TaxID=2709383 RepID=A0A6B3SUR3_9BURK|nr:ATP-binding protein [Noviherbaspirillum galbum]NEX62102.1 response regulator [Noviherbaspirillum galbum]